MLAMDDILCLSIFVVCLAACFIIKITDSYAIKHRDKIFAAIFLVIVLFFVAMALYMPTLEAARNSG